ncbi:MAG: sulfotransferase family protein [Alteromonadaceae bacterium]|nr:sulfotransferase family protein [Alteromonadaceae bacterium]
MQENNKIFIIGLPRTGTTSICVALLNLGYKVAHTAYTQRCIETAQVIADTPVFCDYQTLAQQYPQAKFIYLQRSLELWLPSIRQLLQRMHKNIVRVDGGFNPILKRCYKKVFSPFELYSFVDDDFLIRCYQKHQQEVGTYFKTQPQDLLTIDVSDNNAYARMLEFLSLSTSDLENTLLEKQGFQKINVGGKITAWNNVKSEFKIDSNLK